MVDVASEVIEIIAKQKDKDLSEVTREVRLEELEVESLDVVEIIFSIEDKFDITIPFNANDPGAAGADFETVDNVVNAVEKLVLEKGAEA
jgi:acyl carrier protein